MGSNPKSWNVQLIKSCKLLLVPCFELRSSASFVFSRADATESASFNFELWKVCRATSATRGLFRPFDFSSIDGKTSCSAVDGGIVMNNPAAAVTHILHNNRDFPSASSVEDLLALSLGNGASSLGCCRRRRHWDLWFSFRSSSSSGMVVAVAGSSFSCSKRPNSSGKGFDVS